MSGYVYISEPGAAGRSVAVSDHIFIGRDCANDVVLKSSSVSGYHVLLVRHTAGVLLIDLESTNGTSVNHVPVEPDEPVLLADGDEIHVSDVIVRYLARTHDL